MAVRMKSSWLAVPPLVSLGLLLIATDRCSSKQREADDGQVDHTLEEQEEVGVVGRGARELELQHIIFILPASCSNFLYWREENLLICSSFVVLMFDNTTVLFPHCPFRHSKPAKLHVCALSLQRIPFLGVQDSIAILFFPIHPYDIGKELFKETKVCPSLMEICFSNRRKKNSGLGGNVCIKPFVGGNYYELCSFCKYLVKARAISQTAQ